MFDCAERKIIPTRRVALLTAKLPHDRYSARYISIAPN